MWHVCSVDQVNRNIEKVVRAKVCSGILSVATCFPGHLSPTTDGIIDVYSQAGMRNAAGKSAFPVPDQPARRLGLTSVGACGECGAAQGRLQQVDHASAALFSADEFEGRPYNADT